MSSSTGLMVWLTSSLNPVAARTTAAHTANSRPPVMGSGMLYFERKGTLRLSSVPMSSTTTAASNDPTGSRLTDTPLPEILHRPQPPRQRFHALQAARSSLRSGHACCWCWQLEWAQDFFSSQNSIHDEQRHDELDGSQPPVPPQIVNGVGNVFKTIAYHLSQVPQPDHQVVDTVRNDRRPKALGP